MTIVRRCAPCHNITCRLFAVVSPSFMTAPATTTYIITMVVVSTDCYNYHHKRFVGNISHTRTGGSYNKHSFTITLSVAEKPLQTWVTCSELILAHWIRGSYYRQKVTCRLQFIMQRRRKYRAVSRECKMHQSQRSAARSHHVTLTATGSCMVHATLCHNHNSTIHTTYITWSPFLTRNGDYCS